MPHGPITIPEHTQTLPKPTVMPPESFAQQGLPHYARSLASIVTECHRRVQHFLAEPHHPPSSHAAAAQRQTRNTLKIVKDALAQYTLPELAISYNGGKDCLVLLVLFLAGLHKHPAIESGEVKKIKAFYGTPPDSFPAVEEFVRTSELYYHLDLLKYTTCPPDSTLKSCFQDYLDRNPTVKAIFVGTRRSDPYGEKLDYFARTDSGWPDFMRIHSVVDWRYAEIWAFIKCLDLDYCILYDQGYTSLGGVKDTLPNPRLLMRDVMDGRRYQPAHVLTEDEDERLGRPPRR
ncbi:FAD synthase [Aspergillus lucknowensis]|uniref:FAD synthase n=1 Tax=Aspergillus lucknowensis TaxID=176173 RepID=A0ABR4LXF3_9EURO